MNLITGLEAKFPKYGIKIKQVQSVYEGEFTVEVTIATFEEMPKEMLGKGNPTICREVNAVRSGKTYELAEKKALARAVKLLGVDV